MFRARLGRLFWIGAVALLCTAALVSLVALLRGTFTETDGRILLTLGAVFLAGSTAIAWYALVERRTLTRLGWAVVCTAPVWATVLIAAIWTAAGDSPWAGTAIVLLIAELVLATDILLLRDRHFVPLVVATAVALAVTSGLILVLIWAEPDGSSAIAKALGASAILTGLGYLLTPVLQRMTRAPAAGADEAVIATLDGIELVSTEKAAGASAAVVVSDQHGRIHVAAGPEETTLPAGRILVVRQRPSV
jgi:hypothetical protein